MLKLLSLLQARPNWTGPELASRLAVTERTLRRDITRLRDLGYPVEAISGPAGGYQLTAGGAVPPLLFDDDEAITVALSLRSAASGSLPGFEDTALAALAKIEQVLPRKLSEQMASLQSSIIGLGQRNESGVVVAPETLVNIAQACRRQDRIRFGYVDAEGNTTDRHVEPYQLVYTSRRWYLVARDRDRDAWRSFRVDRISRPVPTGIRFVLVDPPDAAAFVAEGMAVSVYKIKARVLLKVPYDQARRLVSPTIGVVERRRRGTLLRIGADDPEWIARYLASLDCEFSILEPDELKKAVSDVGARLIKNSI
jgi:predicted DNA-binding transcriptional regulator YafY